MRVSIFISCCILSLYCASVQGDLPILGSIRKVATKAKENVQLVFNSKSTGNTNEGSIVFKDSEEEVPVATTPKAPEVTPGASVQRNVNVETTTATVINNPTEKINASDKDGRENFAGGCSSGYYRTSDGRCKPTF